MNNDSKMNWSLDTSLPVSFVIKSTPDAFEINNTYILTFGTQGAGRRRLVIIDLKVSKLYLPKIKKFLEFHKVNYHLVIIDAVEDKKNIENLLFILQETEKFGLTRKNEPILAIGGGVLLDMVGLAASLYRR